jgi:hypothetical protein
MNRVARPNVVDPAAADDHLRAVPGALPGDRQQQRGHHQPRLLGVDRLVERVEDQVEVAAAALAGQPLAQGRHELVDRVRDAYRRGPGDLDRHVERGLALDVHGAGHRAERRGDVAVVGGQRGPDVLVGGRDDPAEHGGLADAGGAGHDQHPRVGPGPPQPVDDLAQCRAPAAEPVAALGVDRDAARPGTPVAYRLDVLAQRPAPRLEGGVAGRRDRPRGQLAQPLVGQVLVDLVQGDRLRVAGVGPAAARLPD